MAGAVNTSIIGSNGVLNRVAEDGVMPDWFLKPHRRYGTTYRILFLIAALQLLTIVLSGGDMYVLGEAYAFGVVWSFVFKALAMVVLRFKDRSPREFKVPLNMHIGGVEIPFGLIHAVPRAVLHGLAEPLDQGSRHDRRLDLHGGVPGRVHDFGTDPRTTAGRRASQARRAIQSAKTAERDQPPQSLNRDKLIASSWRFARRNNLFMLERTLHESDPETTDVIVMTAKVTPAGGEAAMADLDLDRYEQQLMTAVVERAERAGKQVKPLIVPTNNPLFAVVKTAKELDVQELVIGASNKFTTEEQLDQISFYWMEVGQGQAAPLTIRVLGPTRDVSFDIAGGNRIRKFGERQGPLGGRVAGQWRGD